MILVNPLPWNAEFPIVVRLVAVFIVAVVKLVHDWNALLPIVVSVFGSAILVICVAPAKTLASMDVTLYELPLLTFTVLGIT
jgi:hypothetical protein